MGEPSTVRWAAAAGAVVVTVVALAVGSSGHSGSKPATTATDPAGQSAQGTSVSITNFTYTPSPLTVKVGDTITVTNNDDTDHTLTADDHSLDTGRFSSGTRTVTATKAGTISYHCDVHNFMTGVIQVDGA